MLAAVVKRTKRTLFDEPYVSFASSSNKSKNKITKKNTQFLQVCVRNSGWTCLQTHGPLGTMSPCFWVVVLTIFYFSPIWGRFPFWLIFFKGLKPPTRKNWCVFSWCFAHRIHRGFGFSLKFRKKWHPKNCWSYGFGFSYQGVAGLSSILPPTKNNPGAGRHFKVTNDFLVRN